MNIKRWLDTEVEVERYGVFLKETNRNIVIGTSLKFVSFLCLLGAFILVLSKVSG